MEIKWLFVLDLKNKSNNNVNTVTSCALYRTCGLVNNEIVNEGNINSEMRICTINVEQKDMKINDTFTCVEETKLLTPWTYMETKLKRPNCYTYEKNKPNINRIMNALNQTNNSKKYPNMSDWFKAFLDGQEYNDSDMEHEFDDCSFNDWLKDEKDIIDKSIVNE